MLNKINQPNAHILHVHFPLPFLNIGNVPPYHFFLFALNHRLEGHAHMRATASSVLHYMARAPLLFFGIFGFGEFVVDVVFLFFI